jgi:DNA-directed RNA polymerase subunit RPC12/RpoP
MDDRMLDANATAGLLREVFADDMTTAIGTCGRCGAREAMGTAHAYEGAGMVLRCPHCDHALVTLVRSDTRLWIGFPGMQTLEITVGTT